jgi:hypothetical protein
MTFHYTLALLVMTCAAIPSAYAASQCTCTAAGTPIDFAGSEEEYRESLRHCIHALANCTTLPLRDRLIELHLTNTSDTPMPRSTAVVHMLYDFYGFFDLEHRAIYLYRRLSHLEPDDKSTVKLVLAFRDDSESLVVDDWARFRELALYQETAPHEETAASEETAPIEETVPSRSFTAMGRAAFRRDVSFGWNDTTELHVFDRAGITFLAPYHRNSAEQSSLSKSPVVGADWVIGGVVAIVLFVCFEALALRSHPERKTITAEARRPPCPSASSTDAACRRDPFGEPPSTDHHDDRHG